MTDMTKEHLQSFMEHIGSEIKLMLDTIEEDDIDEKELLATIYKRFCSLQQELLYYID